MLACKADCKYIGRLAEHLGKSDEAGLRTQLSVVRRQVPVIAAQLLGCISSSHSQCRSAPLWFLPQGGRGTRPPRCGSRTPAIAVAVISRTPASSNDEEERNSRRPALRGGRPYGVQMSYGASSSLRFRSTAPTWPGDPISQARSARYEKTKQTKTGHPNKLVLKQQTEGAAIKTESAVPGAGGYIERDQLRDQRGQRRRYWPPFAPWVQ
jgi:hypothetical protein